MPVGVIMYMVIRFSGISLTWLAAATLLLVVVATADPTCSCVCSLTADGPLSSKYWHCSFAWGQKKTAF